MVLEKGEPTHFGAAQLYHFSFCGEPFAGLPDGAGAGRPGSYRSLGPGGAWCAMVCPMDEGDLGHGIECLHGSEWVSS